MAETTRGTPQQPDEKLLNIIATDVAIVKNDVAHLKEIVDTQMEDINDMIEKLRAEVYGNGNPTLGLRADVGSLKEWRESVVWWYRAITVALVIEAIGLIKLIFFGG